MRTAFGSQIGGEDGLQAWTQDGVSATTQAEPMEPPKTAGEVRDVLAKTMAQVHARQMDTKTASTLAYLASSLLRAMEVSDWESRSFVARGRDSTLGS
jgi:hypothetical protein